jgi:RimJ/RimL family protein N-acetyltransferase
VPELDDAFAPVTDARPQDAPWPAMTWPPAPGVALGGRHVEVTCADPARDAEPLFAALDDERVWQHVKGRPDTAHAYAATLDAKRAAGTLQWVVRLRAPYAGLPAGTVVGTTSYLDVSVPDARLEIGSTAYAPAVWGTAVNPDAKRVLLAHAFDVLGAGRVQLKTDVRNVRSQRAIARLGARYEGTLRRYQRRGDGTVRDTVVFSILAEEWPAVRAGLEQRLRVIS